MSMSIEPSNEILRKNTSSKNFPSLPVIVDQFSTKFPWQKACRGILWKNISSKNISSPWSLINSVANSLDKGHAVDFYEKIFRGKIFPSRDRWSKIFRRKIFPSRDRWSILYRISSFTRGMPWNFTKKYFIEKLFLPMLLLMKFYEKIFEKRLLPVFVVLSRSNRKVKEVSGTIDDAPFNILSKKSIFSHYTPQTTVSFIILVR